MMLIGNAESQMLCLNAKGIHLINIVKVHVDQGQIQYLLLYQGSGTNRAVFKELYRNVRMQLVKLQEEIRKKDCA